MSDKKKPHSPMVKVAVTEKEIAEAMPRDSGHCMIADAVRAAFPTAKAISVDLQTIRFTDPGRGLRYTYLTPRSGQVALVKFDQGIPVEPFAFRLRAGHVTRSGKKTKDNQDLLKTELRGPNKTSSIPRRVGGQTPPIAAHGKRRAFGLRGLEL